MCDLPDCSHCVRDLQWTLQNKYFQLLVPHNRVLRRLQRPESLNVGLRPLRERKVRDLPDGCDHLRDLQRALPDRSEPVRLSDDGLLRRIQPQ